MQNMGAKYLLDIIIVARFCQHKWPNYDHNHKLWAACYDMCNNAHQLQEEKAEK